MKFGALAVVAVALVAVAGCTPPAPSEVTIRFHYSHFTPDAVRVRSAVPVTIKLVNDDPIDHEWIIGSPAVHDVHRRGTDAVHDQLPTEVSVPALSTKVTTVVFAPNAEQAYVCHLPGHEEYGMTGLLRAS
jgi:uncharacterized cupredoxin-like copper-binding protein